jgi:small subunit ribosomal protein S6
MEIIMNKYETIFLISNQITEEQRKSIITKIVELISKNGTITNKEELGEKKLAYEIRKHTQAFYYIINFESEAAFVYELERNYRIIDEILKFIVVRQDD